MPERLLALDPTSSPTKTRMRIIDACDCCNAAKEAPAHAWFDPACLHCGARLIQRLGKLPRPRDEITARRRKVLADWVAYGHAEADLRELAKGALALAPEPEKRGRA